jgi:hypothetical protein
VSLESGSLGVVSLCDEQDRGPSSYGSTYSASNYRRWTAEALQEQDSESPSGIKGYRPQGEEEEEEDEDWEEASRRTSEGNGQGQGEGLWGYYSPWRGGKGKASQGEAVSRRVPERLVLEAGVANSPPTWPYTPSTVRHLSSLRIHMNLNKKHRIGE